MNHIEQFSACMAERGLHCDDIRDDGILHRFTGPGDKPGKQNGWYVLHGDGTPAGAGGSWRTGAEFTWCSRNSASMSEEERAEYGRRVQADREKAAAEREKKSAAAAEEATRRWEGADPLPPGEAHPYLKKKGVRVHGEARISGGSLALPVLHTVTNKLQSLQTITDDAEKRFHPGGQISGGCIPVEGDRFTAQAVVLVEGYATGCSVAEALEGWDVAVVAALDCGNLPKVAVALRNHRPDVRIVIAGDNDHQTKDNPGISAAEDAAHHVDGVTVFPPDLEGVTDFNDLATAKGLDTVRVILAAALGNQPLGENVVVDQTDAEQTAQTAETIKPKDNRVKVAVSTSEAATADRAVKILQKQHDLYQMHGRLIRAVEGRAGNPPSIVEARPVWMRDTLSRHARFIKHVPRRGQDGGVDEVPCLVPEWLPQIILERRGEWPGVHELRAIVETPVLLPGGRVLTAPGYDQESGILYLGKPTEITVPELPSREQAEAARDVLFDVLVDFPWAEEPSPEAHRAAYLAFVLTLVARFAIDGPTPFFVFDASLRGSGKGLLAMVGSRIALNRQTATSQASENHEELRKTILSLITAGRRLILMDEIGPGFGGKFWNCLITSWPAYSDRILGKSEIVTAPACSVWACTGNGITLAAESTRRAIPIRLEPSTDRPEERTGFKYPDLLHHVGEIQPHLLTAALTILKAYHTAGSPSYTVPLGSFESWSRLVRDCVVWITGIDPVSTQKSMASMLDETEGAVAVVIKSAWEIFRERTFLAKEFFQHVSMDEGLKNALETLRSGRRQNDELTPRAVGKILSKYRGRISGGIRLFARDTGGHMTFHVVEVCAVSAVSATSPVPETTKPVRGNGRGSHPQVPDLPPLLASEWEAAKPGMES